MSDCKDQGNPASEMEPDLNELMRVRLEKLAELRAV